MPANTTYDPVHNDQFNKNKLMLGFKSNRANCPAGQTTNIDLVITDDALLMGLKVMCKGHAYGDKLTLQVIVPNPAITTTFVSDWLICDDKQTQVDDVAIYPAKLLVGMTLRIIYTSTGASPVDVLVNYKLHTVRADV